MGISDDLKTISDAIKASFNLKNNDEDMRRDADIILDAAARIVETPLADMHKCVDALERAPTLRDRFAGLAMQSLLARELAYEVLTSDLADRAYEVADAMMAAREPREFLKD